MSRPHVFTTRGSTPISAKQPHRKTQITSVNIKPDRYRQPNVCVASPSFLHLHSQPIKRKSVTGPLNEVVRARVCGNLPTTDMSAHCSTRVSDHDIDSERLAEMIYGYGIADQHGSQGDCSPSCITENCQVDAEGSNTRDFMVALYREQLWEILEGISFCSNTAFGMRLLRDAEKAVALAKEKAGFNASENAEQKSGSRRFVMNNLRCAGYHAAICKSRWEQTIAHPAGEYEFIDVVIEESKLENERFFVDIDFRAQFEIARPTYEYNALLQQIPNLFVGRAEKLCGIIKIMCDAARRSLKEREMYLPPWRKYRYVKAKWVGPYRRTTNPPGLRSAQGSYGALLQFPFSGIALKGAGCDATVVRQLKKGNRAADRNLPVKSKSRKQGNEQLGSPDRLLTIGEQDRHIKKISELARALSKAGLTSSSPSNEA